MAKFTHQVDFIRKTCTDRLGILKIVCSKHWNLDTQTRTQIYKSLLRSVIEHLSIILHSTLRNNRTVQYNALRIIHDKDKSFSNKNLITLSRIETIELRMNLIKGEYINLAMDDQNLIVKDLVDDFKYYDRSHNNLNRRIQLCGVNLN